MNIQLNEKERLHIANRVSIVTLIINLLLFAVKLTAGFIGKSNAMIADAVDTLTDAVATIALIIGIHFSSKPADEGHPYGHEKIESVVAKMLSLVLLFSAIAIGINGITVIMNGTYEKPGYIALAAAVLSIVSKECMYRYTIRAAKKINSTALKADAWHHRSDALSSIGTLLGIGGAIMGFEILDPLASLVVSIVIIKVAVTIYITGFKQIIDCAASHEVIEEINSVINGVEGVLRIDEIKTRIHGALIFVDVEISVDGSASVCDGHEIAEKVHHEIESQIQGVKHCMVHINPYEENKKDE